MSALGFKARVDSFACMLSCLHASPQIHLWCDTCWLYRGQPVTFPTCYGSSGRMPEQDSIGRPPAQHAETLSTRPPQQADPWSCSGEQNILVRITEVKTKTFCNCFRPWKLKCARSGRIYHRVLSQVSCWDSTKISHQRRISLLQQEEIFRHSCFLQSPKVCNVSTIGNCISIYLQFSSLFAPTVVSKCEISNQRLHEDYFFKVMCFIGGIVDI